MWRPAPRSLATCSWAAAPRCGTARSCEVGAGAGRTWVLGMSWMGGGIWRPKTGVGGLSCALFLGACSDHHRSCSLPPLPPPPPAGDVNSVVVGEKSSIQDNAIVHVARHNPAGKVRRPWELRRGAATMIAVMLPAARAGAPPRLLLICCPSHFRILSAVSRAAAALPRPAPPPAEAAHPDWQQCDHWAGGHHPRGHHPGLRGGGHGGHGHGRSHGACASGLRGSDSGPSQRTYAAAAAW